MRALIVLAALAAPAPALAQPPAESIQLPRELTDPATADRLAKTMQGLTDALLDLKVGEIQAAAEGRRATTEERKVTIRDTERRKDPNFERNLHRQVAEAGPKITQAMKTLSDALPAITKALDDASRAIDRAAANMPDPTYPKR
jgi:uncharacterized protein YPO0396